MRGSTPNLKNYKQLSESEMQEQRDMTGVLFKNNHKKNKKHPNYTGKATVDGKEYQISSWVNISSKGNKFMSITFRPPREEQDDRRNVSRELDDDIPF